MGGPALGAALAFRRRELGLTKAELASRTGFGEKLLRFLESGEREPSPEELARLAAALECEPSRLRELADLLAAIGRQPVGTTLAPAGQSLAFWSAYATGLRADTLEEARSDARSGHREVEAERQLAGESWLWLAPLRNAALRRVVDSDQLFWRWAFVERLCRESETAAADDHERAVVLAEVAVETAGKVAGEPSLRTRLQGYAWGFVANALRVAGNLAGAERAMVAAKAAWEGGGSADQGFLDGPRFLDLEASLRREQRRFSEAEECSRAALAQASASARPELLINLANCLTLMTRQEEAVPLLEEAVQELDPEAKPRLAWAARFNLLVCLCALDRAAEGEAWLPDLRRMAAELGNGIDQIRLRWLEAQVHAALGRPSEAIAALEEARDGFAAREMHYDVALAGLELCVFLLLEGQTAEVKVQAPTLAATFYRLGIERERLATLTLFCAAAQAERATVEQARAALDLLRKAEG